MKKLFALVLSLALVVAFAVPAMASGWATLDTAKVSKDITISVTGLETEPNTVGVGKLYEPLKANANYPVVEGTKLHFLVELTIPAYSKLSDANESLIDNVGLDLAIETTNMKITKASAGTVDDDNCCITETFGQSDCGETYSYEVWAKALSDEEAKVVATAGFYNTWKENEMKIYDANGDLAMVVTTDDSEYKKATYFTVSSETADVTFYVLSNGQVDADKSVTIEYDGTTYDITKSVVANPDFLNNGEYTGSYNTIKAQYDKIFKFLGFDYDEADYITSRHFTQYFGTIGEISASYSWNAGKVIVNPVTPDLPQTGDNASIVGFAMIVVAMVAAAVVTVKKVRA